MFYYKLATYYRPRFYADVSVMPFDSNLIYIYISIVVALEETLYSRFFAFLNEKHWTLTWSDTRLGRTNVNDSKCLAMHKRVSVT